MRRKMRKAFIEWFNDKKGFGYARERGTNKIIFVHYSAIQLRSRWKTLNQGDWVKIEYIPDIELGWYATKVRLISRKKQTNA